VEFGQIGCPSSAMVMCSRSLLRLATDGMVVRASAFALPAAASRRPAYAQSLISARSASALVCRAWDIAPGGCWRGAGGSVCAC
jgi:hypothetical protein